MSRNIEGKNRNIEEKFGLRQNGRHEGLVGGRYVGFDCTLKHSQLYKIKRSHVPENVLLRLVKEKQSRQLDRNE